MADDPDRKLELRLVPADGVPADPQVLDDLIRLVRQGIATASKEYPQVSADTKFREPTEEERRDLSAVEGQIKHRIAQEQGRHEAAVVERAKIAAQPDAEQKLAAEARKAAELVVAAVQRALIQRVRVQVPDDPPISSGSPDAGG